MEPVVALIGRPNVGKSTLFNRLSSSRRALVADIPGVTRDRQYAQADFDGKKFIVIDTGGIGTLAKISRSKNRSIESLVSEQTNAAIDEADLLIFLVDHQGGLTPQDRTIADLLRQQKKSITVVVNKCEGINEHVAAAEFHEMGFTSVFPISAKHGDGIASLVDHILHDIPSQSLPAESHFPHVAIVGRPNSGKSTLTNLVVGGQRVIVSNESGTTRDSIYVPIIWKGLNFIFIDTAGVRRKRRKSNQVEKYSALKTMQSIDVADVVVLLIDAAEGITEQDANLAGYILDQGRAMVLVFNKIDLLPADERALLKRSRERRLPFLDFVEAHYFSALKGRGLDSIFGSIRRAHDSAFKDLPTPRVTRVLQEAIRANPPPMMRGRRIQLKYAHQGGKNPQQIIVHGRQVGRLSDSYHRYLANRFRHAFRLVGVPVVISCRSGENPYRK
jgi:GTPase